MSAEIWVSGPIIDVILHGADGLTSPAYLQAIIDTGASGICVDRRIAISLGLVPSNRKRVEMADGAETMATGYRAEMQIEGLGFRDRVEVIGVPMTYPSSRVLLGRSFLSRYIINYDGPRELFHYFRAPTGNAPYIEDFDG